MKRCCYLPLLILLTIPFMASAAPSVRVLNFMHEIAKDTLALHIQTTGTPKPELIYRGDAELVLSFPDAICVPHSMILFNSPLVRRVRLVQSSRTPPTVQLILGLLHPVVGTLSTNGGQLTLNVRPKAALLGIREQSSNGQSPTRNPQTRQPATGTAQPLTPNPQLIQAVETRPLVDLEMQDTDLRQLLRGLARQDNIKLIIHDSVQGRVSASLHEVTPLKAIEEILTANGYGYELADEYLIAAKPEIIPQLVSMEWRVIPLAHAQASELQGVLQGLLSPNGSVQADSRTNSIVLRDTPSNLERYAQLIQSLDQPLQEGEAHTQTEVFFFKHARLSDMQSLANDLLSVDGQITVNEQANALVVTDTPEKLAKIRELTQRFEESDESEQAVATKIFRLEYVDANAILPNLKLMLTPAGNISTFVRQENVLHPARQKSNGTPYKEGGVAVSNDTSEEKDVKKWSDTLIVTDTLSVLAQIEQLIRQLDTLGTQVSIEAQIVEMGVNSMQQLGIQWQANHRPSNSQLLSGPFQSISGAQVLLGTLTVDAFRNVTGAIQALENRGQAKLLAHPRTTTLDNELAQLLVTDRIPIPTLRETQLASTTTYEYLDVGIILTVVPHISESGDILMEISAQVDSVKADTLNDTAPPVISSRVAHSRVRVANGHTLAIGGLTKEETSEEVSGVPVLSRLPLLGAIFRSKQEVKKKTDLLILITPKILTGTEDSTDAMQS